MWHHLASHGITIENHVVYFMSFQLPSVCKTNSCLWIKAAQAGRSGFSSRFTTFHSPSILCTYKARMTMSFIDIHELNATFTYTNWYRNAEGPGRIVFYLTNIALDCIPYGTLKQRDYMFLKHIFEFLKRKTLERGFGWQRMELLYPMSQMYLED